MWNYLCDTCPPLKEFGVMVLQNSFVVFINFFYAIIIFFYFIGCNCKCNARYKTWFKLEKFVTKAGSWCYEHEKCMDGRNITNMDDKWEGRHIRYPNLGLYLEHFRKNYEQCCHILRLTLGEVKIHIIVKFYVPFVWGSLNLLDLRLDLWHIKPPTFNLTITLN